MVNQTTFLRLMILAHQWSEIYLSHFLSIYFMACICKVLRVLDSSQCQQNALHTQVVRTYLYCIRSLR
jgi:archaellum biogenesis protein FlaJ (TadC family)